MTAADNPMTDHPEREEMMALAECIEAATRYGCKYPLGSLSGKTVVAALRSAATLAPGYAQGFEAKSRDETLNRAIGRALGAEARAETAERSAAELEDELFNARQASLIKGIALFETERERDEAREASAKLIEMRPGSCPDRQEIAKELRALRRSSQSTSDAGGGVREALSDLNEFIDVVTSGNFYQDYDASIELLGKANDAFKIVENALSNPAAADSVDPRWRTELDEVVSHLGAAIAQSIATDDQIIMDHVKAAHEIAKVVRRQA